MLRWLVVAPRNRLWLQELCKAFGRFFVRIFHEVSMQGASGPCTTAQTFETVPIGVRYFRLDKGL